MNKCELFYATLPRLIINLQNQNGEGGGEEDRADHCFHARCSTDDGRCGNCKEQSFSIFLIMVKKWEH